MASLTGEKSLSLFQGHPVDLTGNGLFWSSIRVHYIQTRMLIGGWLFPPEWKFFAY